MRNILELQNVSKTYAHSDFSLQNISFAFPSGTIMGFVGENGAGKTTTIGCILNTLVKDSGTIKLFGKEITDQDVDLKEDIGVVYDGSNFPEYLSARQLERIMQGIYTRWDRELFYRYLKQFRLPEDQKTGTFSKGMAMQLAIAAALAHHPSLLILDEATSGLDPVIRDDMLDVFLEFVQEENHGILLSSHITSDLEKIADYITFIHDGRIILTVMKDELIYHYGVLRCRKSEFEALDQNDIIAYRKREFQIDVLVKDAAAAKKKYKDIVADHVSIDEILLLLVKGERI